MQHVSTSQSGTAGLAPNTEFARRYRGVDSLAAPEDEPPPTRKGLAAFVVTCKTNERTGMWQSKQVAWVKVALCARERWQACPRARCCLLHHQKYRRFFHQPACRYIRPPSACLSLTRSLFRTSAAPCGHGLLPGCHTDRWVRDTSGESTGAWSDKREHRVALRTHRLVSSSRCFPAKATGTGISPIAHISDSTPLPPMFDRTSDELSKSGPAPCRTDRDRSRRKIVRKGPE